MSGNDPVVNLLGSMHAASETISAAYHSGSIHKTEETERNIERLRRLRLLSPDIRDTFQLRASLRNFLNTTLSTERLFSMGANVGDLFLRLSKLVEEHSIAFQDGLDSDCERYEYEIREAISDIADAIDDELVILRAQVETKFAVVTTIAAKKRQNMHYQERTHSLVKVLEDFHFSDLGEQLQGHEDIALSFKSLLTDRIPTFNDALLRILTTLNQYLFEYRQVEDRTKRVRSFALHLSRNKGWSPVAWDDEADIPEWLQCASPIEMRCHPDVDDHAAEDMLVEIALAVPGLSAARTRRTRPAGVIDEAPANVVIKIPEPAGRKAIRMFIGAASKTEAGLSAREWWLANPSAMDGVGEESWLLMLLIENDKHGSKNRRVPWVMRTIHKPDGTFDGNVLIRDVVVAGRAQHA